MYLYDPWKWMGISEVGTEGAVLRDHLQARGICGCEKVLDFFSVLN